MMVFEENAKHLFWDDTEKFFVTKDENVVEFDSMHGLSSKCLSNSLKHYVYTNDKSSDRITIQSDQTDNE